MKRRWTLMVMLLLAASLHGQTVVKIVSGYVLLDTDYGIGKKGKTIEVFRHSGASEFMVGKVKILRLQKGLCAAKVVHEAAPYRIRLGDFVHAKVSRPKKEAVPVPSRRETTVLPVTKVVQDYALLAGDVGRDRIGQQFAVFRKTRSRVLDVGLVTIHKVKNGKTVCKITAHTKPFHVLQGDYINLPPAPEVDDVDYYFFGDFVGR